MKINAFPLFFLTLFLINFITPFNLYSYDSAYIKKLIINSEITGNFRCNRLLGPDQCMWAEKCINCVDTIRKAKNGIEQQKELMDWCYSDDMNENCCRSVLGNNFSLIMSSFEYMFGSRRIDTINFHSISLKNGDECLDTKAQNKENDADLVYSICNNDKDGQIFKFFSVEEGYYRIISKLSNKCLQKAEGKSGFVFSTCQRNSPNQLHRFLHAGEGFYSIQVKSNEKCIGKNNNSEQPGFPAGITCSRDDVNNLYKLNKFTQIK